MTVDYLKIVQILKLVKRYPNVMTLAKTETLANLHAMVETVKINKRLKSPNYF